MQKLFQLDLYCYVLGNVITNFAKYGRKKNVLVGNGLNTACGTWKMTVPEKFVIALVHVFSIIKINELLFEWRFPGIHISASLWIFFLFALQVEKGQGRGTCRKSGAIISQHRGESQLPRPSEEFESPGDKIRPPWQDKQIVLALITKNLKPYHNSGNLLALDYLEFFV